MQKRKMRLPLARDRQARGNRLPQRTSGAFIILFPSNDSKLDCLRESSASFCAPTGIDPVGAGQYPNSEMPP
jgi:hypothetical protein